MGTSLEKTKYDKINLNIQDSSKFTKENLMANFTPPILEFDVILSQAYNQINTEIAENARCSVTKEDHKIEKPKTHGSTHTSGNKGK